MSPSPESATAAGPVNLRALDPAVLDALLAAAVDRGDVPAAAAVVADRDGVVYRGAAGPRELGGGDPLTVDTRFRIMSMTKPVVTVAALQLVEQGRLDLDAPVEDYCPQWAQVQVLVGFEGDTPRLRPPASRATVRQLLTHTSGLGYWFWSAELARWQRVTGTPNVIAGSRTALTAPLLADPGTTFRYGTNLDWLGQVVAAAGGVGLDVAVREGVTDPLDMPDTGFWQDPQRAARTTPVHARGADGAWKRIGVELAAHPDYLSGGHGLYSTPNDYLRFQRALLRGGELDGRRILAEPTVRAMFDNQIGAREFPAALPTADPASAADYAVGPGHKWGFGLLLNPTDVPGMRRAGSGGWAGLCNTYFWVDPGAGVAAALFTSFLPFAAPSVLALCAQLERAVYAPR